MHASYKVALVGGGCSGA